MCIYKIAQESRAIINHFLSLSLNFRANHQLPTYLDKTLPKAGLREKREWCCCGPSLSAAVCPFIDIQSLLCLF